MTTTTPPPSAPTGVSASTPLRHPADRATRLALIGLALALAVSVVLFMAYDLKGSLSFALELRGKKIASMVLVGTGLSTASVLFHTISANRILTPSLIGLDALFILIQTVSAFVLGTFVFLSIDERIRFAFAVAVMMAFALALNTLFLRKAAEDLPLLILGGVVLGGMFTSVSALTIRLINPNEFTTLQDQLFASFATVDEQLLGLSTLVVTGSLIMAYRMRRELDVIALGRPTAIALGVDYDRANRVVIVLVAILVSVPTALVGPVTFLGLLAANLAYEVSGAFRHVVTIPLAAMGASTLLIAAQFILEELLAFETRASIIVGFVGGVAFIGLALRETRR